PPSTVCAPGGARCVAEEQVARCAGHADNDLCEYLGLSGTCQAGVCEPSGSEPFTLHVSTQGSGAGRVVSDPPGIDCGSTCSGVLPRAPQPVLPATPVSASICTGWGGPCTATGACDVTVTAEITVAAVFVPPPQPAIADVTPERGTGAGGAVVIVGTNLTG